MYWPTSAAKRLFLSPSGIDTPLANGDDGNPSEQHRNQDGAAIDDQLVHMSRSRNGQMWATLSSHTIAIWTSRPSQVVASLLRTKKSLQEYGRNQRVEWRPDGRALMVQTDQSFLLLYNLVFPTGNSTIYSYIPSTGSGSKSKAGELLAPAPNLLRNSFAPGAGESAVAGDLGLNGLAGESCELRFRLVLRIDAGLACATCIETHMLVSTLSPPAIQCIRWPDDDPQASPPDPNDPLARTRTALVQSLDWIEKSDCDGDGDGDKDSVYITQMIYSRPMDVFVWLTSDGRAYSVNLDLLDATSAWSGKCFHGISAKNPSKPLTSAKLEQDEPFHLPAELRSTTVSINAKFSLITLGLQSGNVVVYNYRARGRTPLFSHTLSVRQALKSTASYLNTESVSALNWTSDGYALAVGWQNGMSIWSTYGKLMSCSLREDWETASKHFSDSFMFGVRDLFWGPGNTELFILSLCRPGKEFKPDNQLFILPFAKSAVAGQHSPDNTRFAFSQSDDSVHVYRGADQPDVSVITPESDAWHHIKIPKTYLAANWPIRYAAISSNGNLIAVAGRRGLVHYSISSGRWKTHKSITQEQSFVVRGGLQWFQHVLIAACDAGGQYQLRLYSRDADLDSTLLLDLQTLPSPILLTSLFDNSLLVYTADNTFYHFLIDLTHDRIRLRLCGSITFEGVVGEPARVRGMSWMIPESHQRFGDPVDDLTVATIIFLIDGKLVLLRPRKTNNDDEEVAYDMQILADKIEYYWTHLQGIGTLENSLWGYDGTGIKLWLDALTIEPSESQDSDTSDVESVEYKTIEESVSMPLDFYPLCVLLEKGIVIGVESEVSLRRSLDFAIFRTNTNMHLFLHQILRNYLEQNQLEEAVYFASSYQSLVYFAHALEILLHAVLEDEADAGLGQVEYSRSSAGSVLQRERSASSLLADVEEKDDDDDDVKESRDLQTVHNESQDGKPTGSKERHLQVSRNGRVAKACLTNPTIYLPQDTNLDSPPNSGLIELPPATLGRRSGKKMRAILPLVVEFLDHFDEALEVVVGCARKTEVARWGYLFDVVGKPLDLFEKCMKAGELTTAGMYLLVLHNLEPLQQSITHTIRLLHVSIGMQNWHLSKDLLRFLKSIDETGESFNQAIQVTGILMDPPLGNNNNSRSKSSNLLIPPLLQRSSSAPTFLDTMTEEDEDDQDQEFNQTYSNDQSQEEIKPTTMTRAKSATFHSPSIPKVTVNGRILPHQNGSSTTTTTSNANLYKGLGMSLSRVGFRSTDKLWESASRIHQPSSLSSPPSPSSASDSDSKQL